MKTIYIEKPGDKGYWQSTGEGPMRPIIAEGETKTAAVFEYSRMYGLQYEEQERMTHFALEPGQ